MTNSGTLAGGTVTGRLATPNSSSLLETPETIEARGALIVEGLISAS